MAGKGEIRTMTGYMPILAYHGLDESGSVVSLSPALFVWQMAWLRNTGCRVLALSDAVACLRRGEPLPARALAITFDDGLESVYSQARPILSEHGFPATVFVVAGYCGKDNGWAGQPDGIPRQPLLSWEQVRELDRHGMAIGAHTIDHARLDLLPAAEMASQVIGSKQVIEWQLGHTIDLFAYPYGRHTPAIQQTVARCFAGACTARPGLVGPESDPLLLDRIDISYVAHPWLFARIFNPLFPLYVWLRRSLRSQTSRLLRRAWV
jgi:peptidoglycan/xylan/chitin deacetylase (PgdA/CDA1 family)